MKTFFKTCISLALSASFLTACSASGADPVNANLEANIPPSATAAQMAYVPTVRANRQEAIVAGGCFWCVESDFETVTGVTEVISGYSGGSLANPTYKQVGRGGTGHIEVAKIIFDPTLISYRELMDKYWMTVDPTDAGGQFCDRGQSYETAIFVTPSQRAEAEASKLALSTSGRLKNKVVTPIRDAVTFYDAEDYHQDYYKKNPKRYKYYRKGCGRDAHLKKLWGQ